ncbi:MAG: hypothetical protein ACFCUU_17795 [Cyclobacteriaceae bacterium]
MKIKTVCLLVFLIGYGALISKAQITDEADYNREFIWGITKSTNSGLIGGFIFKYNVALNARHYHGVSLDIVNIKHPQEQRDYSRITGNTFIIGKENYLYNIRLNYNRELVVFRKAPQQGVQINLVGAAGPIFGLESPYYIELQSEAGARNSVKVPFDHTQHLQRYNDIMGSGNIFQGLFQSNVVPGANIKAAIAFEFGTFKSNVVGIEAGFIVDFYTREIQIIPTSKNFSTFPAVYTTLFYGSRK